MVIALALAVVVAAGAVNAKDNPVVVMETSEGTMTIELYPDKAPGTVQNFLWYVDNGFYDGLIFHRVIKDFMIQGGGFTEDMRKKAGNPPIDNEASNGLTNDEYTLAMARTNAVHSATSQFFINTKDNDFLNYRGSSPDKFGYCVFGKVIDGTDVVDAIESVPTTSKNGYNDVPKSAVVIKKVYRKEGGEKSAEKEKKKE
jgi:cyclophilin family peptidyl-prolyl cis-trans isomerase